MGDQDTSIGAGQSQFPATRWSQILDPSTAEKYWRPVYKFIRIAWRKSNEEAKDLTQEFFAEVFQPDFLAKADPARGNFRTFLLASLKNFLKDDHKHRTAQKRSAPTLPMEDIDVACDASPEAAFTRSWAETLLNEALRELEGRVSKPVYDAFRAHCENPDLSYQDLAQKQGLSVSQVTNYLFEARKGLRTILVSKVSAYAGDVESELRELYG
jgi:RNA polymerase sigma-70 factor (ECF subfamily)